MKIAVLTSSESWFVSYAHKIPKEIQADVYYSHNDIQNCYDIVFILSYFKLVPSNFLKKHKHNLVVHESDLPQGKGWAPLFWQILEGKNEITITLFEAVEKADAGDIYLQDKIVLSGYELHDEIREIQAQKTIELCKRFLTEKPQPRPQKGKSSYYPKRTPLDSKLDINKSIKEQFNLLRIVDNDHYPAFFEIDGHRYVLKIYSNTDAGGGNTD